MRTVHLAAAALAAGILASGAVTAQNTGKESFTAFAINMGTIGTGANSSVDITIERWSTDAERDTLVKAFQAKQQDGLLSALQKVKQRVGFIRLPNTLGYDLRYARQVPDEEGGRRILIATDRRIGFAEARNQPRTIDYPFTLIEMRLNRANEGVGKMAVATKITWNKEKHVLELENYSSEPVRLNNIRKRETS
jgi:hypothetical protein